VERLPLHGSHLAMKGVPMGVIAAQLGHADTRMTEKHYAHLAPNYIAQTIRANFPRPRYSRSASSGQPPRLSCPARYQRCRCCGHFSRLVVSDFRSLRRDSVFRPPLARPSPAAKIPFQTRRSRGRTSGRGRQARRRCLLLTSSDRARGFRL
jgi:hypothetical protein